MKRKLNNLSIYRLIATICVLQFHIFFILYARAIPYETLLSKCVQGLTCLSGFLYSQKLITDKKKFYLSSLLKIVIPALICFLLMATWNLIYMFIFKDWNYINLFIDYRAYNGSLLIQPGNYYYIAYILVCYLITPILQRNDKFSLITAILVILFELSIGYFFGPSIIMVSYLAGYYVGKKLFNQMTNVEVKYSVPTLLFLILLTLSVIGSYIVLVEFPFGTNYALEHLHSLLMNITATTFGVVTFFLLIYIFRFTNKFNQIKLFKLTDKISLNVYLLNQAFMCGAMRVSDYVEPMWAKMILVYTFTIVFAILTYLLYALINKYWITPKQRQQEAQA